MKPIINQIVGQLNIEYENCVMKAVQSVGFDVDKDRLAQALVDAQKFYFEGYTDAMTNHDLVEVVRCKDCQHWMVDETGTPWCDMWEASQFHEEVFCYFGERRADNAVD
jgi:hypothetical protein